MLKTIKKLLEGKAAPKSPAAIAVASRDIDLVALRATADEAARRRSELLLSGTDAEILAAERDAEVARLAVDRAEALLIELDRRRAEAEAEERKAALEAEYAETIKKVADAVAALENEYPAFAARIAEIVRLAEDADDATARWAPRYFDGQTGDLPLVESVMERLGLHNRWMVNNLTVSSATRLLPIGAFEGHGCDWETAAHYHAVNGHAGLPVAAHQFT